MYSPSKTTDGEHVGGSKTPLPGEPFPRDIPRAPQVVPKPDEALLETFRWEQRVAEAKTTEIIYDVCGQFSLLAPGILRRISQLLSARVWEQENSAHLNPTGEEPF
jgi:hypothetical protein